MDKDLVIGLGEIGIPILKTLSKAIPTAGYDTNHRLVNKKEYDKLINHRTIFEHICIPFTDKFIDSVLGLVKQHKPMAIVIHSTISPRTTETIQKKLDIPVIYSATRGVHKRMVKDLKRYMKFYSVYDWAPKSKWAAKQYEKRMRDSGMKTKKMSNPLTLELAKIVVDTSYYGWLITYAQLKIGRAHV